MFTKEDYKAYFDEVAMMERAMIYQAEELIASVKDPVITNPLNSIANDEIRHYSVVMTIIDRMLLKDEIEKREFQREHLLGAVRLKFSGGKEFSAYCVNISEKGICVEYEDSLPENGEFEVWVDFFDGAPSVHRTRGFIKWSVKVRNISYIAGINYRSGLEFTSEDNRI